MDAVRAQAQAKWSCWAVPRGRSAQHAEKVPDLSPLSRRIFRIVDHEGALKEKQIPELAAIRERIRRHREDADRSVRGLLDDHA